MPRSEVLSRPGQKFGSTFLLYAHRCSPLGPQHRVPEPVPSLKTHLKSEYVKGRPNVWRYVSRKEETRLKSNGRYERMENTKYGRRREGRWTPHGRKPRTPEAIPKAGKLT